MYTATRSAKENEIISHLFSWAFSIYSVSIDDVMQTNDLWHVFMDANGSQASPKMYQYIQYIFFKSFVSPSLIIFIQFSKEAECISPEKASE
jgi:hypothetical protein